MTKDEQITLLKEKLQWTLWYTVEMEEIIVERGLMTRSEMWQIFQDLSSDYAIKFGIRKAS